MPHRGRMTHRSESKSVFRLLPEHELCVSDFTSTWHPHRAEVFLSVLLPVAVSSCGIGSWDFSACCPWSCQDAAHTLRKTLVSSKWLPVPVLGFFSSAHHLSHRFIPTTATTIDADAPRGACCWSGWIISVCVFYKPGILHGSSRWPQRKAPLSPCAATQLSTAAGNMLADLTRRARAHTSKNTAQSLVCCCLCKEPCQNLTPSGLEQMLLSNQIFTEPLKGQRGKTFLVHFCNL